jgi:hypothetical protein
MRSRFPRPRSAVILGTLLAVAILGLIASGCRDFVGPHSDDVAITRGSGSGSGEAALSYANPKVRTIMAVQNRHTTDFLKLERVVGTATGLTDDGRLAVLVLTESPLPAGALPMTIEGIPVVEEVTGKIRPYDSGPAHQVKQTPPIQLGTSGGWRYDLANGYCCSGTLGSLIKIGSTQYVLSNYHVLEADIVNGGNGRVAVAGDPVIQPGMVDISCNAATAQNVATLSGIKSLPGSNVDAAIAQVVSGMVSSTGSILDVGTISTSTVGASLNQAVKKSGRTTGLTRSTISGLNASVSVQYENECAGGVAFTKTYTGQILIKNRVHGQAFISGGDSGSLMVEDVTTHPRAVGLLFAGSSQTAVANPINSVLSFFGATMVGQ